MALKKSLRFLCLTIICTLLFSATALAGPPRGLNPTIEVKKPITYGGGSFLEDQSTFANKLVQMSEANGYVYISWVKDRPKTPKYYVSIAKDGKWVVRNKMVFEASGDASVVGHSDWELHQMANMGNIIYLTYIDHKNLKYHIQQVSLNSNGDIALNKTIVSLPLTKDRNYMRLWQIRPLYTSKGPAIMFNLEYEEEALYKLKETTYTIFLASTQAKAASFTDKTFALNGAIPRAEDERSNIEAPNAYWDIENNMLYHIEDRLGFVKKFNTAAAKPILDTKGEEISLITKAIFLVDNQSLFAFNSSSYNHWVEKFDNKTMRAKAVTDYFRLEGMSYNNEVFVTSTTKEIHIWEISTHGKNGPLPVLKLITIDR